MVVVGGGSEQDERRDASRKGGKRGGGKRGDRPRGASTPRLLKNSLSRVKVIMSRPGSKKRKGKSDPVAVASTRRGGKSNRKDDKDEVSHVHSNYQSATKKRPAMGLYGRGKNRT